MSRQAAVRVDHLCDLPLDRPGLFLRLERRHWPDGTSCLHIAKWGVQPETGRPAPWWPLQYVQIPWELAEQLGSAIVEAATRAERGRTGGKEVWGWPITSTASSAGTPAT